MNRVPMMPMSAALKVAFLTIFSLTLTSLCALDARAQYVPDMDDNTPTVAEEHRSRSNWEQPLVNKDQNLRHYYWTDIEASKPHFTIVNPATGKYEVQHRTASSCRPKVIPTKCRNIWAESMAARAGVEAKLRPISIAHAKMAAPMAYSYGSYGSVSGRLTPASNGAESSYDKQVKARVMSY